MYFIFTIYLIISICGRKTWGHWVRRAPGEEDGWRNVLVLHAPDFCSSMNTPFPGFIFLTFTIYAQFTVEELCSTVATFTIYATRTLDYLSFVS